MKLHLYLGERQASILQTYQSLSIVASHALGGKSSGKSSGVDPNISAPKTAEEAQRAFMSVFGHGN